MMKLAFLLWLRPVQYKFLAALAFALLMLWGCDQSTTFPNAEKKSQAEEELKLHRQRSENFGYAKPIEAIDPFPSRKAAPK